MFISLSALPNTDRRCLVSLFKLGHSRLLHWLHCHSPFPYGHMELEPNCSSRMDAPSAGPVQLPTRHSPEGGAS
jgi:hypothetical protein